MSRSSKIKNRSRGNTLLYDGKQKIKESSRQRYDTRKMQRRGQGGKWRGRTEDEKSVVSLTGTVPGDTGVTTIWVSCESRKQKDREKRCKKRSEGRGPREKEGRGRDSRVSGTGSTDRKFWSPRVTPTPLKQGFPVDCYRPLQELSVGTFSPR